MTTQIKWTNERLSPVVLESVLTASRESHFAERRTEERYPFFSQVMLEPFERTERKLSAYSREISAGGIGLLHVMPLELGNIYQVIVDESLFPFRRFAEVLWCRSAGHGWFLSGWRFVTPAE